MASRVSSHGVQSKIDEQAITLPLIDISKEKAIFYLSSVECIFHGLHDSYVTIVVSS